MDLDKYLSCYLNQFRGGAIEVQEDAQVPTFMHFAVKHGMKELIKTLLTLPGGAQMATMANRDGLNARDLAVHSGNLELANLLKDPKVPRQNYEFPVLKSRYDGKSMHEVGDEVDHGDGLLSNTQNMCQDPVKASSVVVEQEELKWDLQSRNSREIVNARIEESEDAYFYDIPRKVEQCYVVPPPPRPVEAAASKLKLKYVSMNRPEKTRQTAASDSSQPQSRQELLRTLCKTSSIEDLPEPEKQPPSQLHVRVDIEKGEPLDIVNPFPPTLVQNEQKTSPKDRLKSEFSQVQTQLTKGQIGMAEAEMKFKEWKASLSFTLVEETNPEAVGQLTKQWEDMLVAEQKNETKVDANNEKSFRKKFTKLIKSGKKKTTSDSKYSTLPSMPLRLKKAKTASMTSVVAEARPQIRNKSCSVSETSRNSDSESSCSSSPYEKHENISD